MSVLGTRRAALGVASIALLAVAGPVSAPAFAADAPKPSSQQSAGSEPSNKPGDGGRDPQWQAQADPDGDENGGVDQPGGEGGVNTDDQDGNNGTGNDSDCEDDNNGKGVPGFCKDKSNNGKSDEKDEDAETPGESAEAPGQDDKDDKDDTDDTDKDGDESDESDGGGMAVSPTESASPAGRAEVLGVQRYGAEADTAKGDRGLLARAADAVLPNTGAGAALMALVLGAIAALVGGYALIRRGRATT